MGLLTGESKLVNNAGCTLFGDKHENERFLMFSKSYEYCRREQDRTWDTFEGKGQGETTNVLRALEYSSDKS